MRKKIVCILMLIAQLLLPLSPALASTTGSQLDYSFQNYGIVTASIVDSFAVRLRAGQYDMNTDTYSWGSWLSRTSTDGVISSTGFARYTGTYEPNVCMAIQYEFSDFGSMENIRALLGRNQFFINYDYGGAGSVGFYQRNNQLQLFSAYVDYDYSGTLYKYNESGTTSALTSSAFYTENLSGASFSPLNDDGNRFNLLLDTTLPMGQPALTDWKNNSDGIYDEVRHVVCDSFTLTFVIRLSNNWITSGNETPMFQYVTPVDGTAVRFNAFVGDQVCTLYDTPSGGDTSGIGSLQSSIQSSINSLSSSVSTQITEVKEAVSTGVSNITTKIDTMSSEVKTGLDNVVSNAKENTQQIVDTVTEKIDEVTTGITEVKDAVVDLPNKLEEKAIGLVVPDDEVISGKFDEFNDTLEQELGIMYEVPQMVYELGDTITSNVAEPQKQMSLPSLSLPMADGKSYELWGDLSFDIIPVGMEVLSEFLFTMSSLVMVTVTVRSIKIQYELFLRDKNRG